MTTRLRATAAGLAAGLAAAVRLAWRARPPVLAAYLATQLVAGLLPGATVWLAKVALDKVTAGAESAAVAVAAVALAVVGLGFALVPPALRYLQNELGRAVTLLAKDELYRTVGRLTTLDALETPSFRDKLRLAEQASRGGPADVVDSALSLARSALALAGVAGAVMAISQWIALAVLAAALPSLVAEIQLSRRRAALAWQVSPGERRELFYTELLTNLDAAKELRLFDAGRLFHLRMLRELTAVNADLRRLDRLELRTQAMLAALSAALSGGALVWALSAAARGLLTPGDVSAVIVAMAGVQSALAATVNSVATGFQASLVFEHYREVVAAEPDLRPKMVRQGEPRQTKGIELVDVWFRYADGLPWVLRGVTATLAPGEAVALVGENGSGKSTLVKLLCRFYDPTRGAILWHGVDIRDLPVAELRRRIGAVFQDFMCYELTAAENVAIGDVDGRAELDLTPETRERIVQAATRAGIHDTLAALPRRYDTLLSRTFVDHADTSADGVLLSGGQWQRLALARALLRGRREVLILDEPSSGLDAGAEHELHQLIKRYRGGGECSSLLISHRLSAVRDADRILVLSGGHIIEDGTHEGLLAADGSYAQLFRLQASGYQQAQGVPL